VALRARHRLGADVRPLYSIFVCPRHRPRNDLGSYLFHVYHWILATISWSLVLETRVIQPKSHMETVTRMQNEDSADWAWVLKANIFAYASMKGTTSVV
jgi:hypothetical protein